ELLSFQLGNGDIWIGELDKLTGLFKSENGLDFKIGEDAAPLIETFNGPEFGYDSNEWSVVFTKEIDGIYRIWESKITDGEISSREVASGTESRQSALATKNPNATSTRIVYSIGGFDGVMAWKDLTDLENEFIIDSVDRGIRWIDNSNKLAYVKQTGQHKGEIAIYDTDTQTEEIISDDGRSKTNPYGWYAPEYDDELLVAALLDSDTKIGVYKKNDSQEWELFREIEVPDDAQYDFFGSPEPFTAAGKSYFSCVIKKRERAYSNSEVWIISLSDGIGINTNLKLKIEDDLGTVIRTDPETFTGENEVFIYYNVINSKGKFEAWRARTGIETLNSPDITLHRIAPADTDENIDGNPEPNYVLLNNSTEPLGKLLLYFPGTTARPYDYLKFSKTAANMGYHVISLSYENLASVNYIACGQTNDTTCHRRAREEIWFGENTHEILNIDFNNSIINRLEKLLNYLATNYPQEGWEQFISGGEVQWNKITTAGHSQGGGHAGFAAKNFLVERSVMFAASDWVAGQTADWIRQDGLTPKENYYGFIHEQDFPAVSIIIPTWTDYGILDFGMPVNVDNTEPPYGNVHGLLTNLPVPGNIRPHNYTIVDFFTPNADDYESYVYSPVWEYLLTPDNATGTIERESHEITVFPNPTSGSVYFDLGEMVNELRNINILNALGQRVATPAVESNEFDISGLPNGLYFIHLEFEDNKLIKKVIKE
ncbi:MAG: T9SS type A sorting domain-containing protein, partial [Bacteroidota bacterium]